MTVYMWCACYECVCFIIVLLLTTSLSNIFIIIIINMLIMGTIKNNTDYLMLVYSDVALLCT